MKMESPFMATGTGSTHRYDTLRRTGTTLARSASIVSFGIWALGLGQFFSQARELLSDAQFTWGERQVMAAIAAVLLGLLVIVGIFFIFQVDPHFKTGIVIGLVSALLGSLFPVLNKRILKRVSSENVTLYELSGGFLVLSLLMPLYLYLFPAPSLTPGWQDWIWLLVLAWACTVLAFNLSMSALRHISAFTVNLSYNLEPVYGILLAFVLFREDKYLNKGFYIGFCLILLSIILQTVRLKRRRTLKLS